MTTSGPTQGERPLEGVTVVSLEQAVAAPLATRHLADMGARIIKIERIDGGDFARDYDDVVDGLASHFVWLNRSKESVALDLKSSAGVEVLERLVAGADVFLQNLAPGALERMGFGLEDLAARYPGLVIANMSGYGTSGPFGDHRAYDMLVQAETGLIAVTGTPEEPAKTGVPTADLAAGMYTLSGVLGALFRKARTGRGAIVDVSMFDATIEWMSHPMYMSMYTGQEIPRMGIGHPAIVPYDAYPTKDGQVLIGVQNNRGWVRLVTEVFDRPEWADHPDYETNVKRCRHRETVDELVSGQTIRFTSRELLDALVEAGVPAARLNSVADMVGHPQLAERGRWAEVETEKGPIPALLPPVTFRDVAARMDPVPGLGAHTSSVLAGVGYAAAEIDDLRRRAVIA
ncbi:CoA transferase [Aeromicrobium sp. S22]|uniref:CaiB/BaiF CoA transferase family protein n=1 Tax=Aeromicrobium sp. S22 TaxID=2662029 RepID=UPI0013C1C4EF|nr:CaiB/BaiF CoA-transferase family protein [Aeromicrobium sp. S22]MRK01697.1 CoA transferase [Aeromicrobium sp. S22]